MGIQCWREAGLKVGQKQSFVGVSATDRKSFRLDAVDYFGTGAMVRH